MSVVTLGLFFLLLMLTGATLGAVVEREGMNRELVIATIVVSILFLATRFIS